MAKLAKTKRPVRKRKSTVTPQPRMVVKPMALTSLVPYERNPRQVPATAVAAVAASLKQFGWQQPIVVDSHNVIAVGHTRRLAALSLGWTSAPVVVIPDDQAAAYRLVDNRSGEFTAWDDDLLRAELDDLPSLDGFDLEVFDFDGALSHYPMRGLTDPDDIPAPKNPISRVGDIWTLGKHRLMCGDATNPEHVGRRPGRRQAADPSDRPAVWCRTRTWNGEIGHVLNSNTAPAAKSYLRKQGVSGDTVADWSVAFEIVASLDTAYVWHASVHATAVSTGLIRIGFTIRQQIIWKKPSIIVSRQHYNWQHEPCVYAFKTKHARWCGPTNASTVWEFTSPKSVIAHDKNKTEHPTQKPVGCMQRPIANHRGDAYDPFMGSGTTLIAGESEGRSVYGLEINPLYVDVAVARWEAFTGQKAVKG